MPMLNYGERAKFKNGTDKPFIYRGGLKELLLPAFANGLLHTWFPLQLFLSSTTSLLPLLTLALALAGRSTLQCPMGRVPLVSWTFPLSRRLMLAQEGRLPAPTLLQSLPGWEPFAKRSLKT